MARVFSAINIEDQKVLEELEKVRDSLDLGFNPVKREKMHITLQFFNDIDQNQIERIRKSLESVEMSPFQLEIKGIGAFPSEDFIRVLWAGAQNGAVYELHKEVSTHDVVEDTEHDFKPHITLMRVENGNGDRKKKLKRTMREFEDHSFGSITVDSIKLYESVLNSRGTVYKELHETEL